MAEIKMVSCCTCGYEWRQGQDGSHSCAQYMAKTIERQAAEIERLREALHRILSAIPPQQDGGGFIVEHHSLDGDYIGHSNVDPFSVVHELAAIADKAIGGGNG